MDEVIEPKEDEELTKAIEIVSQACAAFVGDLNAHGQIQAALTIIKKKLDGSI